MPGPALKPEEEARVRIDEMLEDAGWEVQDHKSMNIGAAKGVAVREFPTAKGPADYLLYVDRKAIGTIEAKPAGTTLLGVESQGDRYAEGFQETAEKKGTPAWGQPLPFHYMSTSYQTLFASRLDPVIRPREVFSFHRPEGLAKLAEATPSMRTRLRTMPPVEQGGLHDIQVKALNGIETSLRDDRQRALVTMTMGSGKTYVAVSESYRLIKHGGAERILFIVDRINLGLQAYNAFRSYVTPDDGRKFEELYNVQLLRSQTVDPAAKVVITTLQRLYSVLRGDKDFDETLEQQSQFEMEQGQISAPEMPVAYQPHLPPEMFDVIWIDECHRSIYGRWGQVLDYFDSFLIGMTATASNFTYGYFNGNVVAEYSHEESVADGINVPYQLYRIDTEISSGGATIAKGETVQMRDKITGAKEYRELEDELTYDEKKLDRAVVASDQIRTVIKAFKEKLLVEIFPGRKEVPKTVFFCKDDQHAEDVLQVVREEFARGSDFARKITYRSEGDSQKLIQDFRTDPVFRIAVTVDQIATGTDIKAIECLVFMRMLASRSLFEQMKGRGVRRIQPDELQAVTPDNRIKDHFVIVDCVGVTDEDNAWKETKPLDSEPSTPLKSLLQRIAEGVVSADLASTVGDRLLRLEKRLDDAAKNSLKEVLGVDIESVARDLVLAGETHTQIARAVADTGNEEPTEDEVAAAAEKLAEEALAPLLDNKVREALLDSQARAEQTIDAITQDKVTFTGWVDKDAAQDAVQRFEDFVADEKNRDQYIALRAYFEEPYRRRLKLSDIKDLVLAIETPPLSLTPEKLWDAYERIEKDKVRGEGGKILTDIVSLIRFAVEHDELVPFTDVVRLRFQAWLGEQESADRKFSEEQVRWLTMAAEHIATSMTISREHLELDPFIGEGGLMRASQLFEDELDSVLDELNQELVIP